MGASVEIVRASTATYIYEMNTGQYAEIRDSSSSRNGEVILMTDFNCAVYLSNGECIDEDSIIWDKLLIEVLSKGTEIRTIVKE